MRVRRARRIRSSPRSEPPSWTLEARDARTALLLPHETTTLTNLDLIGRPTPNPVVQLLRRADRERWCVRPWCTTCGGQAYRNALAGLQDRLGDDFGRALGEIDLWEVQQLRRWSDLLRTTLQVAVATGQLGAVLRAWLPEIGLHPRVADVVLFYFVRRGAFFAGLSVDTVRAWIDACVVMAVEWADESLLESLLYTAPSSLLDHPGGREVAEEVAQRDQKVRRALRKAGVEPA